MIESEAVIFLVAAVALLGFGVLRPWPALVALLVALPFNGLLVNFGARSLHLAEESRVALAAWHDALAVGIIVAALIAQIRHRQSRPRGIELLAGLLLAVGLIYIVVSPYTLTAVYAYRTLFEPVLVFVALLTLARTTGVPGWLGRRLALALIGPAIVASLFTWWQVYVGGFMFLDLYYHDAGEVLSVSYSATYINQPRGIGTFNSPNEFGAYLSICIGLLVAPRVVTLRPWMRAWALAILGLALLLSFSRSGWLSTTAIVAAMALLNREALPDLARRLRDARVLRQVMPPLVTSVLLVGLIAASSGAPRYVGSTVTGTEPSAEGRGESAAEGFKQIGLSPWGLGLGTAGPKSTRFGETGSGHDPTIHSETWYLDYVIQVGIPGLLALVAFVLVIARTLWRGRAHVLSRAAFAIAIGPALGAVFIPILDDPAVAMPFWSVLALGVIAARGQEAVPGRGSGGEANAITPA